MSKKKKSYVPSVDELLRGLTLMEVSLLQESCSSCALAGDDAASRASRALAAWIKGGTPAAEEDNKALHGLLLSIKAKG